jgi:hypothetical protein
MLVLALALALVLVEKKEYSPKEANETMQEEEVSSWKDGGDNLAG